MQLIGYPGSSYSDLAESTWKGRGQGSNRGLGSWGLSSKSKERGRCSLWGQEVAGCRANENCRKEHFRGVTGLHREETHGVRVKSQIPWKCYSMGELGFGREP